MAFDIQAARQAGYSDSEISDHLAKGSNFNLAQARNAGYSDGEIIDHLSKRQSAQPKEAGMLDSAGNLAMGVARGAKDVIDTGAQWLASGFDKLAGTNEGLRVKAMNEAGKSDFEKQYGESSAASVGRFGGQVLATLPVGGAIAAPVKALASAGVASRALAPLADAIATGGMRAEGLAGAAGLAARSAGGAVTGGATAAMVNPEDAGAGAAIGAVMPGALKLAGAAGNAALGAVRPFFKSGQERLVSDILKQYANDPQRALAEIQALKQVVPGSLPTTAAAAGDVGLSGLQRTMQNSSPEFAAELTNRITGQNTARTAALEGIAGTAGKIATAKAERNAATDAMRESVLGRAGNIDAQGLLSGVDNLLADPNNAGRISQAALSSVRDQLSGAIGNGGTIDARALYALRKDINDVLSGKLQGEAGNLRYASGQLNAVKGMFDDAIDSASRRAVPAEGAGIVPSWKDYLITYTEQSKPINQMEVLQDVLKRMQTGATDTAGNLMLSPAKLNQILKNDGADLAKRLSPEQLQILRNVAADMNAGQLAMNAGKATGSNTVQNIAQDQLLRQALGNSLGGSTPVRMVLGNLLRIPYGRANQEIQQRIGSAMLNPEEAARLLESGTQPGTLAQFARRARPVAYRSAPILAADPRD
ncbi:hypothetical protein [Dechloromonas denitrificans]|uniref:hypothetical protein n=1 Tax=Dechloromonas denitrificans TaxID=281362 RepID=UPI001CF8CA3A|nr:hypothetical protein [Dechloromonas denitrificans]UCV01739.1 hypothetical protein KI611_11455 [Dechloromonas denitrificans]